MKKRKLYARIGGVSPEFFSKCSVIDQYNNNFNVLVSFRDRVLLPKVACKFLKLRSRNSDGGRVFVTQNCVKFDTFPQARRIKSRLFSVGYMFMHKVCARPTQKV